MIQWESAQQTGPTGAIMQGTTWAELLLDYEATTGRQIIGIKTKNIKKLNDETPPWGLKARLLARAVRFIERILATKIMPPERGQVSSLRVFGLPKAAGVNRRVKFATPGATERQLEKVTRQIDRFLMHRRNKTGEGEVGVAKPVPEWGERLWIEWG
jgi:hypothetical protein